MLIPCLVSARREPSRHTLPACLSKQESQPLAQVVQVQHDTIMQVETIRETIYQTRIVTKHMRPKRVQPTPTTRQRMLASNEVGKSPASSPALNRQTNKWHVPCFAMTSLTTF